MGEAVTELKIEGRPYVLMSRDTYRRLVAGLPELPPQDRHGHRPAVAMAKAMIARTVKRRRVELGLESNELAELSRLRPETLRKIESGTYRPTREMVARLEEAFRRAAS